MIRPHRAVGAFFTGHRSQVKVPGVGPPPAWAGPATVAGTINPTRTIAPVEIATPAVRVVTICAPLRSGHHCIVVGALSVTQ